MTKAYGTIEFKEFNFHKWIEIRKGKTLYKGFIYDENHNLVSYTRFCSSFDECLEVARMKVEYLTDRGVI